MYGPPEKQRNTVRLALGKLRRRDDERTQKPSTCRRVLRSGQQRQLNPSLCKQTGSLGWFDTRFSGDQWGADRPHCWEHEVCSLVFLLLSSLALSCKVWAFQQPCSTSCSVPQYLSGSRPLLYFWPKEDITYWEWRQPTRRRTWETVPGDIVQMCPGPDDVVWITGWSMVWTLGLEKMVPPAPGEKLLTPASATSAQWPIQSGTCDPG